MNAQKFSIASACIMASLESSKTTDPNQFSFDSSTNCAQEISDQREWLAAKKPVSTHTPENHPRIP